MTNEELVTQYQGAQDAEQRQALLDQLYRKNRRGLKAIAQRYAFLDSAEDLQQEAFFGLVDAADTYRPGEAQFFTYARRVITRHLFTYLHDHTGLVNRSESQERLILAYCEFDAAHRERYNRRPTDREIAFYLDISESRARRIREEATFKITSLSDPVGGEDGDILLEDTLPDPVDKIAEAEEELQRDEQAALLWQLVEELDAGKRDVILAKYRYQRPVIKACEEQGISYTTWASRERAALEDLRKNRRLLSFLDKRSTYRGTGLQTFRNTGTSAPEYAVLEMYKNRDINEIMNHYANRHNLL